MLGDYLRLSCLCFILSLTAYIIIIIIIINNNNITVTTTIIFVIIIIIINYKKIVSSPLIQNIFIHVYNHTYKHTYIHTYIHIYIHTYKHTCIQIYIYISTLSYSFLYMSTNQPSPHITKLYTYMIFSNPSLRSFDRTHSFLLVTLRAMKWGIYPTKGPSINPPTIRKVFITFSPKRSGSNRNIIYCWTIHVESLYLYTSDYGCMYR